MNSQRRIAWTIVWSMLVLWAGHPSSAQEQPPYVGDPDPDRPMKHVQPPIRPALPRVAFPKAPSSVINGITFIDVAVAAGIDFGGSDLGNEPAITTNPLSPNQIVLTSFSGSNWFSGGNSSFFYSGDGGASWTFSISVPRPTGIPNDIGCPCDQTVDWGRDGVLYATFLQIANDGTQTVFSAQATNPIDPGSWVYRAPGGTAQSTSLPGLIDVDQPWIWSGPLPGDNGQTNVSVAYDNFDPAFSNSQMRAADSPGASPLDFSRDHPSNGDGQQFNDGMNPGTRIAVGPDGKIYNVFQRYFSSHAGGVKELTYLINVSTDGGQTWSVANSDHISGAKIVAANQLCFQGNGSKVAGVNALLGGVDAVAVDRGGNAWVVYGARATETSHDQLFLVKVTYLAGSLTVGTPVTLSSSTLDSYLPAVAVLPNNEVGVLFLTWNGTNFQWRFQQYTNGLTLNKTTGFPTFTSPFASNGASNQRIFGDYVQVRAVGCTYHGTYPAKGVGPNSLTSIDPYFMSAPSQAPCTPPTLTTLVPAATCAGAVTANIALKGTGYSNGATGRIQGSLRSTTFNAPAQVTMVLQASDLAAPATVAIDLLGAAPAGGLTSSLPLSIESPAGSPGDSLRAGKSANVDLNWSATLAASSYAVHRCDATAGPCSPVPVIASPVVNAYADAVLSDGVNYWYTIDAVNSCGAVP